MTTDKIYLFLESHRKRLKAGDKLPFFTEIAGRAGIHRDTIYALLNGEQVSERTQYALTRVMREIEEETAGNMKTRLMSISLNQGMPRLHIGLQAAPILRRR
jgi:DNA-binding transcriptional regulator YhcF (GntR family)